MRSEGRIGYVLKVYPRFSETFIVTEILAREAQGEQIAIFALRPTTDTRFHGELARVTAPVHHIGRPTKPLTLWAALRDAATDPVLAAGLSRMLPELLAADVDDAVQAVLVARAARREGITHLHAHFASAATTVARLAALLTGIPYSFTAHAKDLFHESVSLPALGRKLRDAAFAVTVSDFNHAFLRRTFPGAEHVYRVYNGLELARFPLRSRGTMVDATDREPLVLAVGRLVEKKGFALLIDAVALLRERGRGVRLDIVGAGELEDDLAARIRASGHADAIRLRGPLPQDGVARLLREADVFAAPCLVAADGNADGLPTVLLEAMATGTPCISTDVTGIPEIIRHGETGLLCRAGHLGDLVAAIDTAISPGFDATALTGNARALVEREFDAARQAAELARLTSAIAERRAA